jgi:predicted house-cleaning noncanonical NTP pyrophosphatase (MazG superfamily)
MKGCSLYQFTPGDPDLILGYCTKTGIADHVNCGGKFSDCDRLRDPEVKRLVAESMAEEIAECVPDREGKGQILADMATLLPDCVESVYQEAKETTVKYRLFKEILMGLEMRIVDRQIEEKLPKKDSEKSYNIRKGILEKLSEYSDVILKMYQKA